MALEMVSTSVVDSMSTDPALLMVESVIKVFASAPRSTTEASAPVMAETTSPGICANRLESVLVKPLANSLGPSRTRRQGRERDDRQCRPAVRLRHRQCHDGLFGAFCRAS